MLAQAKIKAWWLVAISILTLQTGCIVVTNGPETTRDWTTQKLLRSERLAKENWSTYAKRPKLCLSMSGGGIRSASFNIGVLSGLHEVGVLQNIDQASAVSGGAYALVWYYNQLYYLHRASLVRTMSEARDRIFEAGGAHQTHLERNASIISRMEIAQATTLGTVVDLPFRAILKIFTGDDLRNLRETYLNRLLETFANDVTGKNFILIDGTYRFPLQPSIRTISSFAREKRLPFFIFNGAVVKLLVTESGSYPEHPRFEVTPILAGSPITGYWPSDQIWAKGFSNFEFGSLAAVSGAAIDSTQTGMMAAIALKAIDADLGYTIQQHIPASGGSNWVRDWLYVTDGGHVENLGLQALVERNCEQIIVVDAEYDPDFQFSSYKALQSSLGQQEGIELSVPAIDDERFDASVPVLSGHVFTQGQRIASIVYVKLSMNRENAGSYPEQVESYAMKNGLFPQIPTTDQDYAPERYVAYRDLGRHIVLSHLVQRNANGSNDAIAIVSGN